MRLHRLVYNENYLNECFTGAVRLLSGSNAEVALNVLENTVAKAASLLDVTSLQRETQTLCGSIRFVNRHMAPPYSAVIPQVVVQVIIVNTKRDFCLLRCHLR